MTQEWSAADEGRHDERGGVEQWSFAFDAGGMKGQILLALAVSEANDCEFCMRSHRAAAVAVIGEADGVDAVIGDLGSAPVTDKMRALLGIAAKVQRSGLDVTEDDIAAARAAGASDEDIHDAVLVAAAFCMYNRYVDGLRAITPTEQVAYDEMGQRLAEMGYMPPSNTEPALQG